MSDERQDIVYQQEIISNDEPDQQYPRGESRAFGFWATLGITLGALVAAFVPGVLLVIFGAVSSYGSMATFEALAMLVMGLPVIVVIVLAAHFRGGFRRYCAIDKPSMRNVLYALAALGGLFLVAEVASLIFDLELITEWQQDLLRNATTFQFWLYMVSIILMAPLWEEVLFRGFMYRGWAASFIGTAGAIVLPCILWTMLHIGQYDWGILSIVMLAGLVIGVIRWKTGSLTLCILMHFLNNLIAIIRTLFVIEVL